MAAICIIIWAVWFSIMLVFCSIICGAHVRVFGGRRLDGGG